MTDNVPQPTRPASRRHKVIGLFCFGGIVIATAMLVRSTNRDAKPDIEQAGDVLDEPGAHAESVSRAGMDAVDKTEQFAEKAQGQLDRLIALLGQSRTTVVDLLKGIAVVDVRCSILRPTRLTTSFDSASITVHRADKDQPHEWVEGFGGLRDRLVALSEPLIDAEQLQFKFKIISVEMLPQARVTTDVLFQISGVKSNSSYQQNAVWSCVWRDSGGAVPLLEQLAMEQYEEVAGRSPTGQVFADCTESVFRNEPSFHEQLLRGIDYWRSAIQAQHGVYPYGHHGIAVGDVNGDGLDDLYACQPSGLPNRLYVQNADGTVRDIAAESGVNWLDRSRGALLLDLDNDGDQDLVVVLNQVVLFLSNDGHGRFTERAAVHALEPGSMAAADYDLDGDIDIFITNYGDRFLSVAESSGPEPYHDANNGGPNVLLQNDGEWVFSDVTAASGLNMNNTRWSLAASWEDFDDDGDFDLYVANDFGRNNLYRNDGGHFVDIAATAGVEDIAAGMSVSWADYDRDGRMDLYVGNMFSSAGLRIANQEGFQQRANTQVRSEFQRHARGNSLFRNQGNGTFADVSVAAGVTIGRWAWGSKFVDINNDGWEDVVVANGFVTGHQTNDL
ncbi:MAG TPA: VCBS repeat-containing protein [Planctomycetes bacterium]|nr:VCBS repeat-containing protein [Fuerstiella sp.]HIK91925.1 VCBS repeat-containing protein [Planctomycetota bacterium]